VRALYPNKHITAIFQPHLFTRTRDFQEGFAASLGLADRLLLLDIYPAREKPIEGISSKIVFDRVPLSDKILLSKSEVIQTLTNLPAEVVVTIGAGDVDGLLPALKEMLLIDS
jgi:UDP-N-acetylmuramate--alanine ligase